MWLFRSIIAHFNPRIKDFQELNNLSSLSIDQVRGYHLDNPLCIQGISDKFLHFTRSTSVIIVLTGQQYGYLTLSIEVGRNVFHRYWASCVTIMTLWPSGCRTVWTTTTGTRRSHTRSPSSPVS